MKYAIKVTEHLTKVEIVEANSFNKAKEKVVNAYFNEDIILNADNSDVDVDFEDDFDCEGNCLNVVKVKRNLYD